MRSQAFIGATMRIVGISLERGVHARKRVTAVAGAAVQTGRVQAWGRGWWLGARCCSGARCQPASRVQNARLGSVVCALGLWRVCRAVWAAHQNLDFLEYCLRLRLQLGDELVVSLLLAAAHVAGALAGARVVYLPKGT